MAPLHFHFFCWQKQGHLSYHFHIFVGRPLSIYLMLVVCFDMYVETSWRLAILFVIIVNREWRFLSLFFHFLSWQSWFLSDWRAKTTFRKAWSGFPKKRKIFIEQYQENTKMIAKNLHMNWCHWIKLNINKMSFCHEIVSFIQALNDYWKWNNSFEIKIQYR